MTRIRHRKYAYHELFDGVGRPIMPEEGPESVGLELARLQRTPEGPLVGELLRDVLLEVTVDCVAL